MPRARQLSNLCAPLRNMDRGYRPDESANKSGHNPIFRDSCLDQWAFESVAEARAVISQWREEYNNIRPHGSLGGRSPAQYIKERSSDRSASIQLKQGVA